MPTKRTGQTLRTVIHGDSLKHEVLGTLCLDGVWDLGSAEGFLDHLNRVAWQADDARDRTGVLASKR